MKYLEFLGHVWISPVNVNNRLPVKVSAITLFTIKPCRPYKGLKSDKTLSSIRH